MNRRGFLATIGALIAAPAAVFRAPDPPQASTLYKWSSLTPIDLRFTPQITRYRRNPAIDRANLDALIQSDGSGLIHTIGSMPSLYGE